MRMRSPQPAQRVPERFDLEMDVTGKQDSQDGTRDSRSRGWLVTRGIAKDATKSPSLTLIRSRYLLLATVVTIHALFHLRG